MDIRIRSILQPLHIETYVKYRRIWNGDSSALKWQINSERSCTVLSFSVCREKTDRDGVSMTFIILFLVLWLVWLLMYTDGFQLSAVASHHALYCSNWTCTSLTLSVVTSGWLSMVTVDAVVIRDSTVNDLYTLLQLLQWLALLMLYFAQSFVDGDNNYNNNVIRVMYYRRRIISYCFVAFNVPVNYSMSEKFHCSYMTV